MSKDYTLDIMLRKLDTKIKTLETNPNVTQEDIDSAVKLYNNIMNLGKYSEEDVAELEDRLRAFAPNLSVSSDKNDIQNLSDVSPKSFKVNKGKLVAAIAGSAFTIAVASIAGCTIRNNNDETIEMVSEENSSIVEPSIEPTIEPKVLADNLSFDPNDNTELVNRMVDFIADALSKGIPVKDVMTEEEIKIAEDNEESLVTIQQLIDFYIVMNIEDIDPEDYARLKYNSKTAETITDNYMYCARIFMTDALTATNDTKIDYSEIIADKDSSESIQKFVDYLAEYNSSSDKKTVGSTISNYIVSNYINRDANLYSMSANEFTYRMMFVADMISNNSIIPNDVNIILNEDGKISCDIEKEDGVKDKTEKAEEFTSIYNTVDEKLEISREFINQDLTLISEEEKKTGAELEKEIKEQILIKNVSYNVNPKFTMETSKSISAKKTTSSSSKSYQTFKDSTGKQVNVSNEELAKYGATNQAEYEAAKKREFEENAKKDPNHTIKDTSGNVVVSGSEVDTEQYNAGYKAGYEDGNYYDGSFRQSNPKSTNTSYVAGYDVGFKKGRNDINSVLDSLKKQESSTSYVDTQDKVVDSNTTIVEYDYTGDITPTPTPSVEPTPVPSIEPTPTPSTDSTSSTETIVEYPYVESDETFTEFEPIQEQSSFESTSETSSETTETIEEITYTSSISNLKALKEELLNMSNIYNEEVSTLKM